MVIPEYMARLDGDVPLSGLDLVEPDVTFLLALPSGEVTGQSRDELGRYITARPNVSRKHWVLRRAVDQDLEMVYGQVTEHDNHVTGSFVAVGRISSHGLLARYQAFFHPDFGMYPGAA